MLSITVRPQKENFKKEWEIPLVKILSKKGRKYIIGLEKGNHFQIAYATEERSNNVRTKIKKALKYEPEDENEKKYWLKIKSHNNPKYLIGYCLKEGNPDHITTNYTKEEMAAAVAYYEKQKAKTVDKAKGDWVCTGINTLCPHVYEYCITQGMCPGNFALKEICALMFGDGLLPLSLCVKIRPTWNMFWKQYVQVQTDRSFKERKLSAQDDYDRELSKM